MERIWLGMEWHRFADTPLNENSARRNMDRFGRLGTQVVVTEADFNSYNVRGSDETKKAAEAREYAAMTRVCLQSEACRDITVWGFRPQDSWINYPDQYGYGPGQSFSIFDENGEPNPAYFAIRDVMLDFLDSQQIGTIGLFTQSVTSVQSVVFGEGKGSDDLVQRAVTAPAEGG